MAALLGTRDESNCVVVPICMRKTTKLLLFLVPSWFGVDRAFVDALGLSGQATMLSWCDWDYGGLLPAYSLVVFLGNWVL